jgi:hypothetical protein
MIMDPVLTSLYTVAVVAVVEFAKRVKAKDYFGALEQPAKDAQLSQSKNIITVSIEQVGKAFDYSQIIKTIKQRLAILDSRSILIILKNVHI